MNPSVNAKAPGKILWIGGYSVLERPNVSYVTTVNAHVNARVSEMNGNVIELYSPQLGLKAEGSVEPSSGIMDVPPPKELLLLKTAAEVASRYACEKGGRLCGFRVETNSDTQFSYSIDSGKVAKSGLGSSAAVTVAAVAAILKFFGIDTSNKEVIHKLAQTSHSIAARKGRKRIRYRSCHLREHFLHQVFA